MPTDDYRLRATVTYTLERSLDPGDAPARVEADWLRQDLEGSLKLYQLGDPTRTIKVEVVQ